jgi:hypothetical protein
MTALPGERMRYCGKCVSGEHTLGRNWAVRHIHDTVRPPTLSPEEYINRFTATPESPS